MWTRPFAWPRGSLCKTAVARGKARVHGMHPLRAFGSEMAPASIDMRQRPATEAHSMNRSEFSDVLGPALTGALDKKGYATLTAVQAAVLDPALAGRDLRISSQT